MEYTTPQLTAFIFILTGILVLYGLGNYYIYRSLLCLEINRRLLGLAALVLGLSFPVAMTLVRLLPGPPAKLIALVGYYYLGLGMYLILFFAGADLFLLLGRSTGLLSAEGSLSLKRGIVPVLLIISLVVVVYGSIHARSIGIRHEDLEVRGRGNPGKTVDIVFVSDVHLGVTTEERFLRDLVEKIESLEPDMVIFGGDLLDRSADEIKDHGYEEILSTLAPPLGVFAITGNHEYFGGIEKSMEFMRRSGIHVLEDSTIRRGGLLLVGRRDRTAERFGFRRTPLAELLSERGPEPVVVLDHTPFDLSEAKEEKVDLQLSGHTHSGQLAPANLITGLMYELDYGRMRKGMTTFLVSSGAGTWGPPLRVGTGSEIIHLRIHFTQENDTRNQ